MSDGERIRELQEHRRLVLQAVYHQVEELGQFMAFTAQMPAELDLSSSDLRRAVQALKQEGCVVIVNLMDTDNYVLEITDLGRKKHETQVIPESFPERTIFNLNTFNQTANVQQGTNPQIYLHEQTTARVNFRVLITCGGSIKNALGTVEELFDGHVMERVVVTTRKGGLEPTLAGFDVEEEVSGVVITLQNLQDLVRVLEGLHGQNRIGVFKFDRGLNPKLDGQSIPVVDVDPS